MHYGAWAERGSVHIIHHQTQDLFNSSIASGVRSILRSGFLCSVVSLVPKIWVLIPSVLLRSETRSAS